MGKQFAENKAYIGIVQLYLLSKVLDSTQFAAMNNLDVEGGDCCGLTSLIVSPVLLNSVQWFRFQRPLIPDRRSFIQLNRWISIDTRKQQHCLLAKIRC